MTPTMVSKSFTLEVKLNLPEIEETENGRHKSISPNFHP